RFTSQYNTSSWSAANIINGQLYGNSGQSWSSSGIGSNATMEFVIDLAGDESVDINRVVFYNYGQGSSNYYSKDFEILVSDTDSANESFSLVIPGTLANVEGPQEFVFPSTQKAKYVLLRILSGYRTDYYELGEFEVYAAGAVGEFYSKALGGSEITNFNVAKWFSTVPAGTSLSLFLRSGNSLPPSDSAWSEWVQMDQGSPVPEELNAQMIQYRIKMTADSADRSPIFHEMNISSVGTYGTWSLPNVAIQSGVNEITAFAIDPDDRKSPESLPVEVSLDVLQISVAVNPTMVEHDRDVNVAIQNLAYRTGKDDQSKDKRDLKQAQTFIAYFQMLDSNGAVVNAKPDGTLSNELLQVPLWFDDALPMSATQEGDFVWDGSLAYLSSLSHTASATTGLSWHGFTAAASTTFVPDIHSDIVQYVYLDSTLVPREIMIEFETLGGDREHRAFWGRDLIALGTPNTA
ncbi:MAG TPA: discoidin domain-containing protein, partial [bacterium]|nr:discoidin domain-containing protein [bacterium]